MPREALTTVLQQAAADLNARLEKSAANPLQAMWGNVDEPNRQAARNAIIGALLGGVTGAGYGAAADPEDKVRGALQNLLTGAALGGTLGGAGTVGINMLTGKTKLPGEKRKAGLISAPTNVVGSAIAGHPATIGGGLAGGLWAARKGPSYGNLLRLVDESKLKELRALQKPVAALAKQRGVSAGGALGAAGLSLRELPKVPGRILNRVRAAGKVQAQFTNQATRTDILKAQLKMALKAGPEELRKMLDPVRRLSSMSRASQAARLIGPAHVPPKLWWAAAPLGLGAGYMADKYIKGDY